MRNTDLRDICREARDRKNYTSQDLEDITKIPASTINNFFATASKAPNVYNAGAICKALGVSLDRYFDITPDVLPEDQVKQLEHDHKTELKLAHLEGSVEQLNKTVDSQNTKENRLRVSLYSVSTLAVILLLVLVGYVVFDYSVPYAGLIQGGQASTAAWIVIVLLAVGVGVIASAFLSALRYAKNIVSKEKGSEL